MLLRRIEVILSRGEERESESGSVEGQWHSFSCRGVEWERRNFRGFGGGEFLLPDWDTTLNLCTVIYRLEQRKSICHF